MATTMTKYNHLSKMLNEATVDLIAGTIKVALLDNTYTFDADDTVWADCSASELAAGDGYTAGGETLAGKTNTRPALSAVTTFDANDVTWASLTKTFRGAVIYLDDTVDTLVKPLIAYILFDSTPADVTINGVDFSILWNGSGILTTT